jgi:DNA mismatch repair ATPase MutL
MAVLNIMLPTQSYDVNVTPDKRKVFLHMEADFIVSLRTALESVYAPDKYKYALNNVNPEGLNKKMSAAALDHGLVLCQKLQESPSSNLELRLSGKSLSPDTEDDVTQDQEESLELVRANQEDEKSEHGGFQVEGEIMVVNKMRFETPPQMMMKVQPSTPQQEGKQAFPSFPSLDRHSFQCKGAGSVVVSPATTGANLKARSLGHIEVLSKTSDRNMQKVVQSQLTGFISQRRGPCKEERCVLASMLFNLKDLSVEL